MRADLDSIQSNKDRWLEEQSVQETLDKAETDSGLAVDVLYTPADLEGMDYLQDIGFPGEFPFTRGVYPSMYRGRLWTMRQYAGFGTAEESNQRYKMLLGKGQTGLSVAFDLPSQLGYDSDDPVVEEEVGRVGVAIDTLRDMEILFDEIPLEEISTNLTVNGPAIVMLAMYIAVGDKQGVPRERLAGTVQNDILKEYLARKTYIFPPEPSLRLTTDIIEYCTAELPRFNPISVTGYHVREAGATAVQEAAYALAAAVTYVQQALARGIDIDVFAPQLSFHFSMARDFFEEIAKIRACRRLWARMMKERFGARDHRSLRMRYFNGGSGTWLTAEEPLNNIIRGTLQCLAGVLAGAQATHVPSYDEAYSIPSEESASVALRTQQVIAFESGVTRTVDPLGGSYYVESITNRFEQSVAEMMAQIEDTGGLVAAIERGDPQKAILDCAYEIERAMNAGERIVVGANAFRSETSRVEIPVQKRDPKITERQIARLTQVKAERDETAVEQTLQKLENAAAGNGNLLPYVLEAVKAYATLGEITQILRNRFGTYQEPVHL
jgi:methylmalonyl-CoA mutase N-terminal domain/subunit